MSFLLDSDVIIDYLSGKDLMLKYLVKPQKHNFFLSVISWLEVVYGFQKGKFKNKLTLFKNLLNDFQVKILDVDVEVAQTYLDCKIDLEYKKIPLADFDLLIGATAIINDLNLVTRNKKHFSRIENLKVFDKVYGTS